MSAHRIRPRVRMLLASMCASLALVGCASIPVSSPVGHIDSGSAQPGAGSARTPDGPAPGASPADIVRGFLAAGAGTENNFSVARSFLTETEGQEWRPLESVSLLPTDADLDSLNYEVTSDQQRLNLSAPVTGLVNSSGIYHSTTPGTRSNLEFSLRQENGEWRISSAPDGLLISQATFRTIFLNYSVKFFTSDFSYLVPDSRWFLRSSSTPTAIVNELLSGPAPYMVGSVVTAIPEGAKLSDSNVVTIENGVARVSLNEQTPAPTDREKGLIRAQIASTLQAVPSISSVELSINGQLVSESLQPEIDATVKVDDPPVVLADGRLARISGTRLTPVDNSPDLSKEDPSDPAVSLDGSLYAYLTDGRDRLMRLKDNDRKASQILGGKDLVGPSIDRFNMVWTAERQNTGVIRAVGPDDKVYEVNADFLAGRELLDLEVSRDGTRIALLSTLEDQPARIDLVGIPRDRAGNPTNGLSATPIEMGSNFNWVDDVSWAGSTSLVALASMEKNEPVQPFRIDVTAPPEQLGELPDGSRISAGEDGRSILVTSDQGEIYSYNSNAWQKLIDISAKDPSYPG
ncbi:LpqB family beta-propeller domain-containing protein [Brevibacterium sp.]|uniref:LpqB family beta-propeller domain-containing protein n=1 Tax=Brevibacterium sp. TaxID=1701 RepID=UPI002811DC0D|nr:LpqB family beta-propeller domain-containing protein [Brevibacterium sp.]